MDPPLRHGLVLQVVDDVAVLGVELHDAAVGCDLVHGLGDVGVGAHAAALFVGHEHLEGGYAHADGLSDAVYDVVLRAQDEVGGVVQDRLGAELTLHAVDGVGQGLPACPGRSA